MKYRIYIFILLILSISCKEELFLQSKSYNMVMVVDGFISNEDPPYTVKLSLSSHVNEIQEIPLEECIVAIFENDTKSETLTETEPGVYKTSEDGIRGQVGNEYKISIETPDGRIYKSAPQIMLSAVDIDTVYAKLAYIEDPDYAYELPGYQFYISTASSEVSDNYFLWKMIETYQYRSNRELATMLNVDFNTIQYYSTLHRCWITEEVRYFYSGTTTNLSVPKISNQPLHFVGTDTKRLQERYSLLTKQYSINEEAYNFWKNLEDQFSQDNFLTVNQPLDIVGNIKNTENTLEIVYGYFTVASVSQKRIFVDSPRAPFYYKDDCSLNTNLEELEERTTPVFLITTDVGMAGVSEWCINCELEGGTIEKPDFWVDKK